MRCPAILLLLSTLVISTSFLTAQTSDEGVHAPDGGTMEIISSIFIPPLPNAPFSATVTAVWTKQLEERVLPIKIIALLCETAMGAFFRNAAD